VTGTGSVTGRPPEAATGAVVRVNGPLVEVEGLAPVAANEVLELGARRVPAEVTSIRSGLVTAQAFESTQGLCVGDVARALGMPLSARLGPFLLGGIYDGMLRPLDPTRPWLGVGHEEAEPAPASAGSRAARRWPFRPGVAEGVALGPGAAVGSVDAAGIEFHVLVPPGVAGTVEWVAPEGGVGDDDPVAVVGGVAVPLSTRWPIRVPRPVRTRLALSTPLRTGQRVIDLLFPVAKGGTAAVPGGFGTGKTVLLQQIVRWADADVIVFVGCGERGNELADALTDLRELEDHRNGRSLLERTVVIANTSNMPVMARESSIYAGMTVAELFRDMGYDAVLLADSTSRWAEALREYTSRSGELPAEEGYPAGLASELAAFYERAGRVTTLGGGQGSVTAIGAVSPPGGDMTEPVTAHTERFVRCLWSLDRDLAYARHYPAVTWRRSFSRDVDAVASWHATEGRVAWADDRARAVALLAESDRLAAVVELVGIGALPGRERMVLLAGRLVREVVLAQSALSPNDAACGQEKQAALLAMVLAVYDRGLELVDGGLPASVVEEVDLSSMARARDDFGPDDAEGVRTRRDEVLAALERLS